MPDRFDVSIQEMPLAYWMRERMKNKELSPSLIFRDALIEKKKEWDLCHEDNNPLILKERIKGMGKTLSQIASFMEKNGLEEKWTEHLRFNDENKKIHK